MPEVAAQPFESLRTWTLSAELDARTVEQLVREVSASIPRTGRLERARAFCHAAVAAYWDAMCAGPAELGGLAELTVRTESLSDIEHRRAQRTGEAVAHLSLPTAAYLLGTLYTSLLPEELRAAGGAFFTPPSLVDTLLDRVEGAGIDWRRASTLDPAAGGGGFLAPVALRMSGALRRDGYAPDRIIEHVALHLAGVEIDPFSAWMAQVFVDAALWPVSTMAGARLPNVVTVGDALRLEDGWRGGHDLVIGNPPYGRISLAADERARFSRSLYGHANLYGVFTDLAVRLCRAGGLVGYVTPASFLGGQYYKNLRALLATEAPPVAIDFIADRSGVFDKVLQETLLVLLRRGAPRGAVSLRQVSPKNVDASPAVSSIGCFELPADAHAPWALPRRAQDRALLERLLAMPDRLADYGLTVSTGPLVWNRHKQRLASEPATGHYPLIWSESVQPGGRFRFSWARKNHVPYFRVDSDVGHLVTRAPVVLVQRTTAKEQRRRIVATVLPEEFLAQHGGVVVENHLNMVRPAHGTPFVSLHAVSALLNSEIADRVFRCTSGSVAVSAFELEALPVPPRETMAELDALLARGASGATVDVFLNRAYGVEDAGTGG